MSFLKLMVSPNPTQHAAVVRRLPRYEAIVNQSGSRKRSPTQGKAGSEGQVQTSKPYHWCCTDWPVLHSLIPGQPHNVMLDKNAAKQNSQSGARQQGTMKRSKEWTDSALAESFDAQISHNRPFTLSLSHSLSLTLYHPVGEADDIPACQAVPKRQALIVAL